MQQKERHIHMLKPVCSRGESFLSGSSQSYCTFTCQEASPLTFNNRSLAENNEPRADQ